MLGQNSIGIEGAGEYYLNLINESISGLGMGSGLSDFGVNNLSDLYDYYNMYNEYMDYTTEGGPGLPSNWMENNPTWNEWVGSSVSEWWNQWGPGGDGYGSSANDTGFQTSSHTGITTGFEPTQSTAVDTGFQRRNPMQLNNRGGHPTQLPRTVMDGFRDQNRVDNRDRALFAKVAGAGRGIPGTKINNRRRRF